jgi:hypothetical protein
VIKLNQRKNRINKGLNDIIAHLREVSDIEGAMLVEGSNSVLACDLPESTDYEKEIPEILALLEESDIPVREEHRDTMFAHQVLDYNGFKILAKKLKDKLTLLVMLQKRGYESLAMLDIENSIRKIYEIRGVGG